MKLQLVGLAALVVCAFAAVVPQAPNVVPVGPNGKPQQPNPFSSLECAICKDICEDLESWTAAELEHVETTLVTKCLNALGSNYLSKLFCDDFVKTGLDDAIKLLSDPANQKESCDLTCEFIKMCS